MQSLFLDTGHFPWSASTGGTAPRAGVDLEPNEPTNKLTNITFRECVAAGNTDDAFAVRANFLTTAASVVFERCVARDCAGGWGSAFSLSNLMTKAPGSSISIVDCTVSNMGGGALTIKGSPSTEPGLHPVAVIVNGLVSRSAAKMWNVSHAGVNLGFFPLTFGGERAVISNPITLSKVVIHVEEGAKRPDQLFAGCHGIGWHPVPCDPRNLTGLAGNVTVISPNPAVCSKKNLGAAGQHLKVACTASIPAAIARARLKSDDCQSDLDCSLNGVCDESGICRCDKPWKGAECGQMNVMPMPAGGRDLYNAASANESWGGTTIQGEDGKFYAFVAVYPAHSLWGSNASVGVADRIEGPYTYAGGSFDTSGGHLITVPYEQDGVKRFTMWSSPYHVFDFALAEPTEFKMLPAPPEVGPAVTIDRKSGTWYALGKGNQIMSAEHFLGPWRSFSNYTTSCKGSTGACGWGPNVTAEDVFFWRDKRGNFHQLWHLYNTNQYDNCNSSIVSGHSFSLPDGKAFITRHVPAYGHEFEQADGTTKVYATLERPTPQFDADGVMTHITFAADMVSGDAGCPQAKMCTQPGYPDDCCPKVTKSPAGKSVCACCNCKYANHAGTILVPLER